MSTSTGIDQLLLVAWYFGWIEDYSFGDDFVLFKIREPGRSKLLEILAQHHHRNEDKVRLARLCFPFKPDPPFAEVKKFCAQNFNLHVSERTWQRYARAVRLAAPPGRPPETREMRQQAP